MNDNRAQSNAPSCIKIRRDGATPMPAIFNPVASEAWNPDFKPKMNCMVVSPRNITRLRRLSASQLSALNAAIEVDGLFDRESICRFAQVISPEEFPDVVFELARGAFLLIEKHGSLLGLANLIEAFARDNSDLTLRLFLSDPVRARRRVSEQLARSLCLARWWLQAAHHTACDMVMPDVALIYQGADAIRAYAAAGGVFRDEVNGSGNTLAHHAANATYEHSDALAAFIEAGGHFHDVPNMQGRTPTHALILNAGTPDAIRAFARAGGRFNPDSIHTFDKFHSSPASSARLRGPEFEAVVLEVLALSSGAT